ncbi:MAG TPA: glycosyltransferase [Bryobacteraceae bacterium]|nr:glycosyltransferase [Bryobacteraceae bacterium]
MARSAHLLRSLPLLLVCPVLLVIAAVAMAASDVLWMLFGRSRRPDCQKRNTGSASVVIPNWNGRDLLERYLPSVIEAMAGNPDNEVIVVDNGSADGSAEFVRQRFPQVHLIALETNLGFGGGSTAGFRAAKNDIVVLLNSDMRVAPDFLAPLLQGFQDDRVFAVACQIFFSDPDNRREETGLSEAHWREGTLRVRHRIDSAVTGLYPCFYGGGGSTAFDRRRFLELGGFDPLLRPFYLEDTDIGYLAWKRGWTVLYQPLSRVWHEHRGTIGKHFTRAYIESVYQKNFALFTWKNIHSWNKLVPHFLFALAGAVASSISGDAPHRANAAGLCRAFLQLPGALASRWRARSLASIDDDEAFRRPLGGYYRDRFQAASEPAPERPRVLFASPYPICPPVHGGAVFMHATLEALVEHCDVHLICLLEAPDQRHAHEGLARLFSSAEFVLDIERRPHGAGSILPHAVREYASDDLAWLIHRQILTQRIDVVQLEYTPFAQYAHGFHHIVEALFEHDVYFQSVGRGIAGPLAVLEYLRALRFELRALDRFDRIQACTRENRDYILQFRPRLEARVQDGQRAAIETSRYPYQAAGREPATMLFLGSFRHLPNRDALDWFVHRVLPHVLKRKPEARLVIVGSEPPPRHAFPPGSTIELRGFVEDVREPLSRYAVFVCPILSGSGVRVKLLEAFASGIPVVSTRIGAEGLARDDGQFCALADDPVEFAAKVVQLLDAPERAAAMAARARNEVLQNWDATALTRRLVGSYREALAGKRRAKISEPALV